jgi:hypothetical protein
VISLRIFDEKRKKKREKGELCISGRNGKVWIYLISAMAI